MTNAIQTTVTRARNGYFTELSNDNDRLATRFVSANIDAVLNFAHKLGKKIAALQKEYPSLLEERTEDEIREELEEEQKAAGDKLAAMDKGKDWKKVKS